VIRWSGTLENGIVSRLDWLPTCKAASFNLHAVRKQTKAAVKPRDDQ